jgi:hypothetical protein
MIKRVSLVKLRDDVPRARCIEIWLGAHADVVRELDGVLEYTVDVAREPRPGGSWDAIATLCLADEATLSQLEEDPDIRERLLLTRADFAESVDVFLVDEHRVIPPGGRDD